jgi:hypothetical protein
MEAYKPFSFLNILFHQTYADSVVTDIIGMYFSEHLILFPILLSPTCNAKLPFATKLNQYLYLWFLTQGVQFHFMHAYLDGVS